MTHAVRPRVMFVISNDHALYYKAYTDWNDLDGTASQTPPTGTGFNYYGYFDPAKCYDYYGDGRFEPSAITTDGYCDTVSGDWSGNFLNWATMSRMDMVRKVLYGGFRSTDIRARDRPRALLPAHRRPQLRQVLRRGADIARLTPFTCEQRHARGRATCATPPTPASGAIPERDRRRRCIRVAKGDFRYWAANERWQCTWDNERGRQLQRFQLHRLQHQRPQQGPIDGLGEKDYIARVKVCVPGLIGSEDCKRYPSGNYKPIGLLHDYGEDGPALLRPDDRQLRRRISPAACCARTCRRSATR